MHVRLMISHDNFKDDAGLRDPLFHFHTGSYPHSLCGATAKTKRKLCYKCAAVHPEHYPGFKFFSVATEEV